MFKSLVGEFDYFVARLEPSCVISFDTVNDGAVRFQMGGQGLSRVERVRASRKVALKVICRVDFVFRALVLANASNLRVRVPAAFNRAFKELVDLDFGLRLDRWFGVFALIMLSQTILPLGFETTSFNRAFDNLALLLAALNRRFRFRRLSLDCSTFRLLCQSLRISLTLHDS